jgi:hypothetical protein
MLGFAWFYSSELGLFNGLQRIQIKKFLLNSRRARGFLGRMAGFRRLVEVSMDSAYRKENVVIVVTEFLETPKAQSGYNSRIQAGLQDDFV